MNPKPDGFIGAVMAAEGDSNMTTLLHGPDGCRKNLAALSRSLLPKGGRCDLSTPFYRGFPVVPCTGIGPSDYIFGSGGRLTEALGFVGGRTEGPVAVVCSPGASLIGDDCSKAIADSGMEGRAVVIGEDTMSSPLCEAYDAAIERILRSLAPRDGETIPGTVSLVGLSVLTKAWHTVTSEFSAMFGMMGLDVLASPGAGSPSEDLRRSAQAEFCVIMCPEYARLTSSFYKERGSEIVSLGHAPVGFAATRELILKVADASGRDRSAALEYIRGFERRARTCMLTTQENVSGRTFRLEADASVALPLTRWLCDDLGLVPASVICPTGLRAADELIGYLDGMGLGDVFGVPPRSEPYYAFCDGNTARLEELSGVCRRGVDIVFPSKLNTDFRPSPVMGPSGAMYLLDRVVNPFPNRRPGGRPRDCPSA